MITQYVIKQLSSEMSKKQTFLIVYFDRFDLFTVILLTSFIFVTIGVAGRAVKTNVDKLTEQEAKDYFHGWDLHGFNLFVSDKISLQRDTPPVPEKE